MDFDFLDITASTNTAFYELVAGGTLTGASFASVGTHSIAERDISATAISGGVTILSGYVVSGGGSSRGGASGSVDFRNPWILSQVDALAARQIPVSIVCTSLTGTSNITASINWHEQVI
jgi:hypothetical protein